MSLFLGLGLWRSQAFYLTLLLIFLFVLMIGFQASVVRAAIMGSLALLAQKTGRLANSLRLVVFTAFSMILLNPLILRWDVGFQLSFLAILGIILLGQPIKSCLNLLFKGRFIALKEIVSTTLSAQIFTLPILIYNFGRISLVSPVTNILVVPTVDFIMILGFLFSITSIFSSLSGQIFLWPCWFLISYSLKVINIFSGPFSSKTIENIHWLWPFGFYLLLAGLVYYLKKKAKIWFLDY